MNGDRYITLREAAAHYGRSEATMSRLVRRLGLTVLPNPQDRRSKLVYRVDLERALSRSTPPNSAEDLRARMKSALERARAGRRELESADRRFLASEEALAVVRGEDEDERLR